MANLRMTRLDLLNKSEPGRAELPRDGVHLVGRGAY
jgi:hypothetical protein